MEFLFIGRGTVLLLIMVGIVIIYALVCDFLSMKTWQKVKETCELNRISREVKRMTDKELLREKKLLSEFRLMMRLRPLCDSIELICICKEIERRGLNTPVLH